MISARDELLHLIDCLSDKECEKALLFLRPLRSAGPACPSCGESDLDELVWQYDNDGEYVTCQTCGFSWDPNYGRAMRRSTK